MSRKKLSKTDKRKRELKRRITTFVVFSIYILLFVIISAVMFNSKKLHTDKTVSIYESTLKGEEPENADVARPENTEQTNQDEPSEIKLLQPVQTVECGDTDLYKQTFYNGEDIKDNGCTYAVKVNRQENIVTVYALDEKGYYNIPVRCMICATAGNDDTPTGLFTTSDRYDWALLLGGVYGQYAYQIYSDILFHSVPYETDSKDRLESWEYNKLGTASSMGCIRLCAADAKWIFYNCEVGTQVNIFDSDYCGPMGRPARPYVLANENEAGWDPTDMTEGNPYMTEGRIFGAESRTIEAGEPYDERSGVLAFSKDMEDKTDELVIDGMADENVPGKYNITYSFADGDKIVKKDIIITVADTRIPIITSVPNEILIDKESYTGDTDRLAELIGSYVEAYDDNEHIQTVSASDMKDGSYICVKTGEVKAAGVYFVECYASDKNGNKSDVYTIKVEIK